MTKHIGIQGRIMYCGKGLENTFPIVYNTPQNFQNLSYKTKKKNLQLFSNYRSGWSKEPQAMLAVVFLGIVFY